MNQNKQFVFPKYDGLLKSMGEQLKLARKRRKLTTIQVAERAGIARSTLHLIEKGAISVAFGMAEAKPLGILAAHLAKGKKAFIFEYEKTCFHWY